MPRENGTCVCKRGGGLFCMIFSKSGRKTHFGTYLTSKSAEIEGLQKNKFWDILRIAWEPQNVQLAVNPLCFFQTWCHKHAIFR